MDKMGTPDLADALKEKLTERRRLPRFHITPCQFHDGELNKNFSVQDISLGGLAIRTVDYLDIGFFMVASIHSGFVKIDQDKIFCQFKVRYLRGTLVGAEWVDPSEALVTQLESLSKPENLAKNLKRYEVPEIVDLVWYRNPVGVDLLLYLQDEHVNRWVLFIHQNFVQWEPATGVRTGRAVAEADEGYVQGIVRLETRLMDFDPKYDQNLVQNGWKLVDAASVIEPNFKNFILNTAKGDKRE